MNSRDLNAPADSEPAIEERIVAAGLTAPRVTPQQVDDQIAGDTEGLEPYQVRVVAEHAMLASNISKLVSFISRPGFTELPRDEQHRMVRQRRAMEEYADALSERIINFKKT
jgi:hypothetical protein